MNFQQQDTIAWLQDWFEKQSNGVWEHSYGIKIDTLDNPGWKIIIDLKNTILEGHSLESVSVDRNQNDWMHYKVNENQFIGYGGPKNLSELLLIFKELVTKIV